MSDSAWALENLARAKQTLPNGYCGLPLQQTCSHPNACLTCDSFLTTAEFLPAHRDQLSRTEQLIAQAEADGRQRLVDRPPPSATGARSSAPSGRCATATRRARRSASSRSPDAPASRASGSTPSPRYEERSSGCPTADLPALTGFRRGSAPPRRRCVSAWRRCASRTSGYAMRTKASRPSSRSPTASSARPAARDPRSRRGRLSAGLRGQRTLDAPGALVDRLGEPRRRPAVRRP
jgi:hypothetical protein